jgi:ribosome modulation factor
MRRCRKGSLTKRGRSTAAWLDQRERQHWAGGWDEVADELVVERRGTRAKLQVVSV